MGTTIQEHNLRQQINGVQMRTWEMDGHLSNMPLYSQRLQQFNFPTETHVYLSAPRRGARQVREVLCVKNRADLIRPGPALLFALLTVRSSPEMMDDNSVGFIA